MDDLIQQLLLVDKQARQRVSKAKKQRAGALEALEQEKKEIRAKNEAQYNAFVEEQTRLQQEQQNSQIAQIDAQYALVMQRLDETYRANGDAWVSEIVADVTKA